MKRLTADEYAFLGHYVDAQRRRAAGTATPWEIEWLTRYAALARELSGHVVGAETSRPAA